MPHSPAALLPFALELARAAEQAILPLFRLAEAHTKADGTEVTAADRAAEAAMRSLIEQRFPGDAILGEEFGESGAWEAGRCWVLDPIDGTASFTLGLPLFGTLVALVEEGEPVVGVIHLPAMGETVYAARGAGCWFRHAGAEPVRVHVAEPVPLAQAVVSATAAHSSDIQALPGQTPYRLSELIRRARKFRFVGDCVQHALVCRGKLHAAVDTIMSPWDIAALVPCIEEAGGKLSTLGGERRNLLGGGSLLSSAGSPLHEEVLAVLAPGAEN
jgi:histidinol-phosphatase